MQRDLELMVIILSHCRALATKEQAEAWDWYAVFCTAWNRLGKSRIEGVDGYEALRYSLKVTQERLQEMKAGVSQVGGIAV